MASAHKMVVSPVHPAATEVWSDTLDARLPSLVFDVQLQDDVAFLGNISPSVIAHDPTCSTYGNAPPHASRTNAYISVERWLDGKAGCGAVVLFFYALNHTPKTISAREREARTLMFT